MRPSGALFGLVLGILILLTQAERPRARQKASRTSRRRHRGPRPDEEVPAAGRVSEPGQGGPPLPALDNTTLSLAPGVMPDGGHPDEIQMGCKELRSKRYISDGYCTSIKPITEVVCTGHCLPVQDLPWYAEFIKVWATTKVLEWRCVEDEVKRKRVHLMCENGESRTYRIKVVKSCKCKRYMRQQNQSITETETTKHKGHHRRRDRRRNKGREREGL